MNQFKRVVNGGWNFFFWVKRRVLF